MLISLCPSPPCLLPHQASHLLIAALQWRPRQQLHVLKFNQPGRSQQVAAHAMHHAVQAGAELLSRPEGVLSRHVRQHWGGADARLAHLDVAAVNQVSGCGCPHAVREAHNTARRLEMHAHMLHCKISGGQQSNKSCASLLPKTALVPRTQPHRCMSTCRSCPPRPPWRCRCRWSHWPCRSCCPPPRLLPRC